MEKEVLEEVVTILISEKEKEIKILIKEEDMQVEILEDVPLIKGVSIDKRIEHLEKVTQNHDRRIEVLEKANQNLTQPLNFYIDDSKARLFKENLYSLWKKDNYVKWIDDLDNIRHICINERYGSHTHIFKLIISNVDFIYIHHEKLQSQLKHDLAIILGFNIDDNKSYQAFKNAYYNAIDSIDKL